MKTSRIKNFLDASVIDYESDVALSNKTKINGLASSDYWCKPSSLDQLKALLIFCNTENIVFDVVGNLTNTYFLETYNSQLIISTLGVKDMCFNDKTVICACGVNLSKFSKNCVSKGISGYEGFIGIPGTIGAAAINNSGAFQSVMSEVVKSLTVITVNNEIKHLTNEELKYTTRNSALKKGEIIGFVLSVELKINNKENLDVLNKKVITNNNYRKKNIDAYRKSLGSVFVSSSLHHLMINQHYKFLVKKIFFAPFKMFIGNTERLKTINTFLIFFFLGIPEFAKHCDSLNRFCWSKTTTEKDFINYIKVMQTLANNKLELEIDIKS